jgi:hypothetical protein
MTLRRILLKKSHGGDRKSSGHFDHLKTEQQVEEENKLEIRTGTC